MRLIDAVELLKEQAETIENRDQEIRDKNERLNERAEQVDSLLKEQEKQIKNRNESLEKAREEIKWLRGMLKKQELPTELKQKMWNALYAEEDEYEKKFVGKEEHLNWFTVYRPWLQKGFDIAINAIADWEGR